MRITLLALVTSTLLLSNIGRAAIEIARGELDGAHYAIAQDSATTWNQCLLLIAHGYRPESAPLVADLFPEQAAYAALLSEGWIIAKTSYRRNGIIVADAITDLDNLHHQITEDFGNPQRTIIEGDSMGGTIATHLMEREDPRYHGAVAVGAALDLRENNGTSGVTLAPLRPLLFMSNRSEILGPKAYIKEVDLTPDSANLRPVLFRIDRDGHVNVNQAERLTALRGLNLWLDRGRQALPREQPFDATQAPPPQPSRAKFDPDNRGLAADVSHVSAIYGNVWLDIQSSDLKQIGFSPGLWAQLKVGDQTYRVRYGKDFSSVERGQWVIFPNADGFFWLSRNWGNAAETADLEIGSEVRLRRFEPAN
ncbi:SAM-dependent chlorinase/fluorinase [Opitutaceae bacterium]|nr:SAM-dependent chlorinase/fluorinase [Opitutaceae bacterium]MDB4474552.1 SAM-dependent chlorinase/fluorinase [Opitutaceae bacterium]